MRRQKENERQQKQEQQAHKLRQSTTIEQLAKYYLEHYSVGKRPSTQRNDRRMFNSIILPAWKGRTASSISEQDVIALHESLRATPYQANRTRTLLHHLFKVALKEKWVNSNPVAEDVERYKEHKRQYWLQKAAMLRLQRALDERSDPQRANADPQGADALRLLILTGARLMEVLHARWEEFDLDPERALWTREAHRNKEDKQEEIPLSDAALNLLHRMHGEMNHPTEGPLFPGRKDGISRRTLTRLSQEHFLSSRLRTSS